MSQIPTNFPYGINTPIIGGGGALAYRGGKNYFVGGTASGQAGNHGRDPDHAVATIVQGTALATANNGDVVHVLPGHTLAGAGAGDIAFGTAGVTYIGYGVGTTKPTITLGTDAGADIDIDAANVTLVNFRIVSNIDSLAVMLDVNAGNFRCYNCDFVTSSAKECINFVNIATTFDDFHFAGCTFVQPTDPDGTDDAADTGCFYFVDSENILIEACHFYGNFESNIFHNKTTKAINVYVKNCTGYQALSTGLIYTMVAAMTGGEVGCFWTVPANTDLTETAFIGTASVGWFSHDSAYGNDSTGGAAGAALLTACS
jgi:hypothetical protein